MKHPDRERISLTLSTASKRSTALLLAFVCALLPGQSLPAKKTVPSHKPKPSATAKKATTTTPHKSGKKSVSAKKPTPISTKSRAKSKSKSTPLTVYRTGHGNRGIGTIKPPSRYTAPLPAVVPEPPTSQPIRVGATAIEFPSHLNAFFGRLQSADISVPTQTTRILQFGDSHTAADMFTGRMRSLFQQRFGNGGAGFTYAGHPFAGYRILGTSRGQTSGWIDEGVHFTKIVNTELGLGGVASTSTSSGDVITLDAPCTRFELDYLDQPGGGGFTLSEDGQAMVEISTDSTMKAISDVGPETLTETCTPGITHHFEIAADSSRPVRLLGTVTEQPGITYEALGLNGAEASLILRWDQPIFTGYLRQRDPSLIVLAYGTNEAGNHNWTYEAYRDLMARLVDTLHATVPEASILVVGPPDRSLRVGRRRSAHWQTFNETLHITEAQRDVCRTHGCAFWSWRDRMGGLGSMNHWAANDLAQADHTHFTSAGYVQLADLFYSDIIAAYDAWKREHPTSTDSATPPSR